MRPALHLDHGGDLVPLDAGDDAAEPVPADWATIGREVTRLSARRSPRIRPTSLRGTIRWPPDDRSVRIRPLVSQRRIVSTETSRSSAAWPIRITASGLIGLKSRQSGVIVYLIGPASRPPCQMGAGVGWRR